MFVVRDLVLVRVPSGVCEIGRIINRSTRGYIDFINEICFYFFLFSMGDKHKNDTESQRSHYIWYVKRVSGRVNDIDHFRFSYLRLRA